MNQNLDSQAVEVYQSIISAMSRAGSLSKRYEDLGAHGKEANKMHRAKMLLRDAAMLLESQFGSPHETDTAAE